MTISNVALCVVSEFIGRTIADIPHLIKRTNYSVIFSRIFSNIAYFRKYMFEIVYSLFCMNSKCGVIQNDLHLNNAVVQLRFPEEKTSTDDVYILYVMDNKSIDIDIQSKIYNGIITSESVYKEIKNHKNKLQFILPHEFMHWSIIDFSRSIIHPYFINLDAFPNEHNDHALSQEMKDDYIEEQRNQIERGYLKIVESFEDVKTKLKIGLIDNFDAVWKLYTAVDIYKFSKFLTIKLNESTVKVDPQCFKLLNKINDLAMHHLTIKLIKTLNEKTPSSELEYPNFDIIKECFHDCIVPPAKSGVKLSDIYIYSNELKYSLDKYDNFPTYTQEWYGVKNLNRPKPYKLNDSGHQRFIEARKQLEIRQKNDMETIWLISRRQKEKNI